MSRIPDRHLPYLFEDIVEQKEMDLQDIGGTHIPVVAQREKAIELLSQAMAHGGMAMPPHFRQALISRVGPETFSAESRVSVSDTASMAGQRIWSSDGLLSLAVPMSKGLLRDIMSEFPCHRNQSPDIMYDISEQRPEEILDAALQPREKLIDRVMGEIGEKAAVVANNEIGFHNEGAGSLLSLMGMDYRVKVSFALTENESFCMIEDYLNGEAAACSVYRWEGGANYWRNAPDAEVDKMRRLINQNQKIFYTLKVEDPGPFDLMPQLRIERTEFGMEPDEDLDENYENRFRM